MSETSLEVHNLLAASYQLDNSFSLVGGFLSCRKFVLSLKKCNIKLLNSSAFIKTIIFCFFTSRKRGEKVPWNVKLECINAIVVYKLGV